MDFILVADHSTQSADRSAQFAALAAQAMCADGDRQWQTVLDRDGCCLGWVTSRSDHLLPHATWSDGRIYVLVNGYLARKSSTTATDDAQLVGERYLQEGPAAVEALDGAFAILLYDSAQRRASVWTDRFASLPLYFSDCNGLYVVAPEAKCFASLPGVDRRLVPGSIAAVALNGALLDEHTYWAGVRLVGPARRLTLSSQGATWMRYWRRRFKPDQPPLVMEPDAFAEAFCNAVEPHVTRFRRPALALSGGYDSRLLLALCMRLGVSPHTVTWGADRLDMPGSDFQTGREVARRAGLQHSGRALDLDQIPDNARKFIWLTDGMTTNLGSFPDGEASAADVARHADALLFGNQLFAWMVFLKSPRMAMRQNGINVGRRRWLLRFLLRRDVADVVLRDYRAQQQTLMGDVEPGASANDVVDILYWQTRFPRTIVSQAGIFRRHVAYVSPFVNLELLDLVSSMSLAQRQSTDFMHSRAATAFPREFEVPLNRKHSRANWQARLRQRGRAQRFLIDTLMSPLASFDEWFDPAAIRAWIGLATAEGRQAPWPKHASPPRRIASSLQALLLRPAFRERIVVNLTALKIWFDLFASAGSSPRTPSLLPPAPRAAAALQP